jgi:hypothetical protein
MTKKLCSSSSVPIGWPPGSGLGKRQGAGKEPTTWFVSVKTPGGRQGNGRPECGQSSTGRRTIYGPPVHPSREKEMKSNKITYK